MKVLIFVALFLSALAAAQACTPQCENCHPYRDVDCCFFWVFNPDTKECEGFSNCNRVDGRTTQREWLGAWRVLDKTCPGYTAYPDAQISYPGL